MGNFKIGARVIENSYPDDLVLLKLSEDTLKAIIDWLVETGRKYRMEFNVHKSEVMKGKRRCESLWETDN